MGKFNWSVVTASPHEDYTIDVKFRDGTGGSFDALPLLDLRPYAPLKNPVLFMTAHAERGTVVWNDDLDIAPERVYEECNKAVSGHHKS